MAFNRLTGHSLIIKLDGKEYAAEVASYELYDDEKDAGTVTFGDPGGGVQPMLKVSFVQSLSAQSLHQTVFDNPGKRDVPFVLAPSGNETPGADNPIFTGLLNFPVLRPTISSEAQAEDSTADIEFTISTLEKKTSGEASS
ncbi:MAG: hypothetical protein PUK40_02130 [Actinomycetaceae bacterium]|nr:hypothetical protein [Arcanobacterium sp.]MDD7504739.1 hypothetical protein [Actinomycetaceae bacterium]MDY6142738.1 hypothetical protein [Arcanobacterium sp.]